MESFFLSETAKYLYLLHSNATALPDFYIFSTEGHLLPVLASEATSGRAHNASTKAQETKHGNCRELCQLRTVEELSQVLNLKLCLNVFVSLHWSLYPALAPSGLYRYLWGSR